MPVTPAFIFAALLWQPYVEQRARLEAEGESTYIASFEAANDVVGRQLQVTSIPKRFSGPMRDIWSLQHRLPIRSGKKPEALLLHKRFRAAYDFLLLREEAGAQLDGLGDWWTRYQETSEGERDELLAPATAAAPKRPRRRRRKPVQPS